MCSPIVKTVDHVASNAPLGSFVARGYARTWRTISKTAAVVEWCAEMVLHAHTVFAVMQIEAMHGSVSLFDQIYSLWIIQGIIQVSISVYGQKLSVQLGLICHTTLSIKLKINNHQISFTYFLFFVIFEVCIIFCS